ncbi:hypothetical protein MLD52_02655 [Puniceicoccaceae bacterium K14]|nr:hypothetical protein [Puniceicoccaceae bacterium K14]
MKVGKGAKKNVPEVMMWRPDFRDTESLPDIKIIRTGFFIAAICSTLALAMVLFVGFREYQKVTTQESLDSLKIEVAEYEAEHSEVVAKNKKFMEAMKSVTEIDTARGNQLVFSDLMLTCGASLKEGIALSSISLGEESITLAGLMNVPADEASIIVDSFMMELKERNADQGHFPIYNLSNMERKEGGGISFTVTLSKEVSDEKRRKK